MAKNCFVKKNLPDIAFLGTLPALKSLLEFCILGISVLPIAQEGGLRLTHTGIPDWFRTEVQSAKLDRLPRRPSTPGAMYWNDNRQVLLGHPEVGYYKVGQLNTAKDSRRDRVHKFEPGPEIVAS